MNDITWGEPELVNVHVWIVVSSLRSPYTDEVMTHSKNIAKTSMTIMDLNSGLVFRQQT